MIKKILLSIYDSALNDNINAIDALICYNCLYGSDTSLEYVMLEFNVGWTYTILDIVKLLIPKKWIIDD